ncbi:hypothetical protein [Segatella buccae]|uniref:hypothetical protein n=1 Tax=Segatella buccae TaxID=28126 RepID=UPI0028D36D7B|nr:hypothetical protein [Segatella buccae]
MEIKRFIIYGYFANWSWQTTLLKGISRSNPLTFPQFSFNFLNRSAALLFHLLLYVGGIMDKTPEKAPLTPKKSVSLQDKSVTGISQWNH